jgi:hypothetical protein
LRLFALFGGTLLFFLGPASALGDERRQAWHDKVARSYVIGLETFGESMRELDRAMVSTDPTIVHDRSSLHFESRCR